MNRVVYSQAHVSTVAPDYIELWFYRGKNYGSWLVFDQSCHLNRHLYIMKVSDDELCPFCHEEKRIFTTYLSEMCCSYKYPEK